MRIFATSDIHLDIEENRRWFSDLSSDEYSDDVLIIAGDISDQIDVLESCFQSISKKFSAVAFVPGNHDLWVARNKQDNSLEKYHFINAMASGYGIHTNPLHLNGISIVGLQGWYDYSFGNPGKAIKQAWMDYVTCVWPDDMNEAAITRYMTALNDDHIHAQQSAMGTKRNTVISFSHFLPRIDLMPSYIPKKHRILYPVLGSTIIEDQVRQLAPTIHVYGHSHVNRDIEIDGIQYINNAFGYPKETRIAAKELLCIYEL